MKTQRLRLPSLGTVLGFTALVVAVVGTANATPSRTIIRKGDFAKGAVTAKALAPGAVHAKALAKGAVNSKALAAGSVGASALGADSVTSNAVAPSAIYGGALGPVTVHRQQIADPDTTADISNWSTSSSVVAKCDQGERLLTGGVVFTSPGNNRIGVSQSAPAEDGWVGQITSDSGGTAKAEVQVVCLK
jgi:hypothetical protein